MARTRWRSWGPVVVVLVALGTVVGFVVRGDALPVTTAMLHDSGVWVTDDADDVYGRMNLTAGAMDGYLSPGATRSGDLDVFQDGASVVARDVATGRLIPVDPVAVSNVVNGVVAVPPDAGVQLGAGVVAVLDGRSGGLRAVRYAPGDVPDLSGLAQSTEALAGLGAPPGDVAAANAASVAVGVDGTVYAVSTSGTMAVVPPAGTYGFGTPKVTDVGVALQGVQVSAVGQVVVFADPTTGTVFLPGGVTVSLPDGVGLVLQMPGPAASVVWAATRTGLFAVPLAGGDPVKRADGAAGSPARPVVVAGFAYGAWAGDPGRLVAARADGGSASTPIGLDRDKVLTSPTFRVNHDRVVLNDMANGRAFDVQAMRSLDEWATTLTSTDAPEQRTRADEQESKPTAVPDQVGARPGRTTVVHVLDNDSDPGGNILAITQVGTPSGDATATIAADGQSVLFAAGAGATSTSFSYTISNGTGEASAQVDVTVQAGAANGPPVLREGYTPVTYPVASGGAVAITVLPDWRDPDGDPVSVVSAAVGDHPVPVTADGQIRFPAPRVDQDRTVTLDYVVTDGSPGVSVPGQVTVRVLAAGDTEGVAPVAEADMVRGLAGVPVRFSPLANDVPGADPGDPAATLRLATSLAAPSGLDVTTDLAEGTVSLTARTPGTFFLDYAASFGAAPLGTGRIRVDVAGADSDMPVSAPDFVSVRGTVPVSVDVVGNDADPAGAVLSVTAATADDPGQIGVAVIAGRWLRVQATGAAMSPNPQVVHYTVTNGTSAPVTGDVTVTQVGPAGDGVALSDDWASVRTGDSVLVDVLANDATTSGQPLELDVRPDPARPSGELPVVRVGAPADAGQEDAAGVGRAYVVAGKIRYVAPAGVDEAFQVAIRYAAAASGGGSPASATLTVTVRPAPTELTPDAPPAPTTIEARGVAGDTIRIPVPVNGVDPDGDQVTLTGITSLPTMGRILAITPTSITYQGFPDASNTGTDTFGYEVTDAYGLTGQGRIRVGLVGPGAFPAPSAVDDTVTAQPGAAVSVRPLVNDLIPTGDDPQVVPLEETLPDGVTLGGDGQVFTVTAPADGAPPVQFSYLLRGAGGDSLPAVVTVKSQPGYLNPPRVYDSVATLDGDVAGATPLAGAWDVDGPPEAIRLTSAGAGVVGMDGRLTGIPASGRVQTDVFTATDADGAVSAGLVYVPAAAAGPPQLLPDITPIQLEQNSSRTVNLADYVFSPRGRAVRITLAGSLAAAPAAGLSVQAASPTALTLTAQGDYVGPGAIGVEVTDGADATDPDALIAYVSIPVQVGPATPVLRCPPGAQPVIAGGPNLALDVTALCHVWRPDTTPNTPLRFHAEWVSPLPGVSATDGTLVTLSAAGDATPGASGQLSVGIDGTQAAPAVLNVAVVAAGRPRLSAPNLTGVALGGPVAGRIALSSPLRDAVPTIVSLVQTGGPPCPIGGIRGTGFTLTPDTSGLMSFLVVASDLADPARTDRQVSATFTLSVYGRPSPPSPPTPGRQLLTHATTLTWTPGADNGAPIDEYQLQGGDGRFATSCGRLTTCEVTGVPNGTPISFQVRAHNQAGWSDWSAPGPAVTPDETPGIPGSFTATDPGDGRLMLTWTPAPVDGTPLSGYRLVWTGGTTGNQTLPGDATTVTITGLDNNSVYLFKLVAVNSAGVSALTATTSGQPSGIPRLTSAPTVTPQDLGDAAQVGIAWTAADPNGPGPTVYQVTRSGPDGTRTLAPTTSTSLADQIAYDGQTYTYTLTAMNGTGGPAHTSPAQTVTFKAVGAPASWAPGAATLTPTGLNGQVDVGFTYPPSRGATSRVAISWTGAATGQRTVANLNPAGGDSSVRLTGLANGATLDVTLQACNETACNGNLAHTAGSAFGPLATPRLQTQARSTNGDNGVCARATGDANGRPATLHLAATGPGGVNTATDAATGSGALASPDWWCIDAGAGNRTITFTATLVTGPTSPARPDSASATATQRSPNDPPAPWAAGGVQLAPTGNNGELALNLTYPASNGNQSRIEVTWPAGTRTLTGLNPAGGTTSLTIGGLTNGVPTSVHVLVCNEEVCSATPGQSPTATPFGPLTAPTINARAGVNGDHKLCVTATADANGAQAALAVSASNGATAPVQTGTGPLTLNGWCPDAGAAGTTLTFTARLTSNTTPTRPNPTPATTTATTPLDPPDPWTPNPIALTPADGRVTIQIIYPACHGSACQLKFTYTRNGATVPMSPVAATPGGGTYNSGFSGLVPGDVLSVSAQLCNEQVCGPASPTVTGSPLGPPGAWGAGQGSVLYATGNDGELAAQVIYPPCNGTSCTITVTWSGAVSGTDTATARTEGSNYTKMFTGLPNGADVSLHAQLCNEAFCGDVSNTATASAFGPLAAPTLTVTASAGDHTICADAAGNGNGRRAHISLTVDNTKGAQSATVGGSGSGALSGRGCVYVGPSGTATFTATVITDTTSPTRSNSPSVSKGATSPASPPSTITDVSIATFAQNPSTLPASVRVSANNLPPGVQATVTIADWCGSTDLTTCRNNNPQASTTVTTNADGTLSVEMGTNMGQGVAATITINGTTVATWGPETL